MREAQSRSQRYPAAIVLSGASTALGIALIVTMIVLSGAGSTRWVAFALGCGMAGASLLALAVHELTSERVRHELEIAQATPAPRAETVPRSSAR